MLKIPRSSTSTSYPPGTQIHATRHTLMAKELLCHGTRSTAAVEARARMIGQLHMTFLSSAAVETRCGNCPTRGRQQILLESGSVLPVRALAAGSSVTRAFYIPPLTARPACTVTARVNRRHGVVGAGRPVPLVSRTRSLYLTATATDEPPARRQHSWGQI